MSPAVLTALGCAGCPAVCAQYVQLKHVARVLTIVQQMLPTQVLCGGCGAARAAVWCVVCVWWGGEGGGGEGASFVDRQLRHMHEMSLRPPSPRPPPARAAGISEGQGLVHVMYVFRDPNRPDVAYDESINLSFRLPVKDEP